MGFYNALEAKIEIEKRLTGVALFGVTEKLSEAQMFNALSTMIAAASAEEYLAIMSFIRFVFEP